MNLKGFHASVNPTFESRISDLIDGISDLIDGIPDFMDRIPDFTDRIPDFTGKNQYILMPYIEKYIDGIPSYNL